MVNSGWWWFMMVHPLVDVHITMERSTMFNGKTHYFDWPVFNSYAKLPEGNHVQSKKWWFNHSILPSSKSGLSIKQQGFTIKARGYTVWKSGRTWVYHDWKMKVAGGWQDSDWFATKCARNSHGLARWMYMGHGLSFILQCEFFNLTTMDLWECCVHLSPLSSIPGVRGSARQDQSFQSGTLKRIKNSRDKWHKNIMVVLRFHPMGYAMGYLTYSIIYIYINIPLDTNGIPRLTRALNLW